MPYEVTNTLRSTSIIRVEGTTPANVALTELSTSSNEVIVGASIRRILWSTGGTVTVARGATTVLTLYDSGDMRFSDSGHVVANNSGSNIVVTITTGGSAILELSKEATYAQPLVGM